MSPTGFTCRVYHRRDGRVSATPDLADVRDALLAARSTRSPDLPTWTRAWSRASTR